jgi:hypothetical protein
MHLRLRLPHPLSTTQRGDDNPSDWCQEQRRRGGHGVDRSAVQRGDDGESGAEGKVDAQRTARARDSESIAARIGATRCGVVAAAASVAQRGAADREATATARNARALEVVVDLVAHVLPLTYAINVHAHAKHTISRLLFVRVRIIRAVVHTLHSTAVRAALRPPC